MKDQKKNSRSYLTGFWYRNVLISMLCALLLAASVEPGRAQSIHWGSYWDHIKELFYKRGKQHEAIQKLNEGLENSGNTVPEETLPEILTMMKKYFKVEKKKRLFTDMVYFMLKPGRVRKVVEEFRDSPDLYEAALMAKRNWEEPAKAMIRVKNVLSLDEEAKVEVKLFNKENVYMRTAGLREMLHDTQTVEGNGEIIIDKKRSSITARKSGKVKLIVYDSTGQKELGDAEITIQGELEVAISPKEKRLPMGDTFKFTIKSNRPMGEVKIVPRIDPAEKADLVVTTSDEQMKEIQVTARKAGTAYILVEDDQNKKYDQARLIIPAKAPSMLYPLISSGASIGLAVFGFVALSGANDKLDQANALRKQGDPATDLLDERDSKLLQSRIFFGVAGAGLALSGYLWYRYHHSKKEYERAQASIENASIWQNFDMNLTNVGITLNYRF